MMWAIISTLMAIKSPRTLRMNHWPAPLLLWMTTAVVKAFIYIGNFLIIWYLDATAKRRRRRNQILYARQKQTARYFLNEILDSGDEKKYQFAFQNFIVNTAILKMPIKAEHFMAFEWIFFTIADTKNPKLPIFGRRNVVCYKT